MHRGTGTITSTNTHRYVLGMSGEWSPWWASRKFTLYNEVLPQERLNNVNYSCIMIYEEVHIGLQVYNRISPQWEMKSPWQETGSPQRVIKQPQCVTKLLRWDNYHELIIIYYRVATILCLFGSISLLWIIYPFHHFLRPSLGFRISILFDSWVEYTK